MITAFRDPSPSGQVTPIATTNIGSWPGTEMADAVKIAFAECPDLPYLPELPARGTFAQLVGRGTAFLSGLSVDLQPAGWRLTDGSGRDHRMAISTLRSDLDELEEHAQGYAGPVKLAVAGPWTLAAMMERPRGDRVLADHGARRELAQSLTEGLAEIVGELRRRLPEVALLIQLDEPMLPAVLRGTVPTASGFSRHRTVDLPEVSATLSALTGRLRAAWDTSVAVHCCAADTPIDLLRGAGIAGLLLDLDQLRLRDWDAIGPALESGTWFGVGALPTSHALTADQVARRVLLPLRALRVEPEVSARLVLTPACGLASASPSSAVQSLRTLRTAAAIVTDQLAS